MIAGGVSNVCKSFHRGEEAQAMDGMDAVDLFAGARGWSEGLRQLGLRDVGIELDHDACRTAVNAGHATIRADVANYPTTPFAGIPGLIASPPCPAFSAAGKGHGRAVLDDIVQAVHDERWTALRADHDPEVWLTLEVGRWISDLFPEWIAMEQVPAVLPIWQAFAHVLRERGYSVWTGVLSSETFGVPQTRRRAILIASRSRTVTSPPATHQAYKKGVPQGDPEACGGMFGGLAPWVSMTDAIGWGMADRPTFTITGGGTKQGGAEPFASTSRKAMLDRRNNGAPLVDPDLRLSPTLTATAGAKGQWVFRRPATTVCGDARIGAPGHRDSEGGEPQFGADSIRLTIDQALAIQSFPPDYPLHGTKTSKFQQIGNAIPPLMAAHILAMATGRSSIPHTTILQRTASTLRDSRDRDG